MKFSSTNTVTDKAHTFKDVHICAQFQFHREPHWTDIFDAGTCRKLSARKYVTQCGMICTVGSINTRVLKSA